MRYSSAGSFGRPGRNQDKGEVFDMFWHILLALVGIVLGLYILGWIFYGLGLGLSTFVDFLWRLFNWDWD
ncbi:hypothetical protein A3K24_03370 [candidate division Kazan bacterium RIFCSPHIGHO2_01_FULL_44_14]|uniref:Uncharacterized protein n=1 Tax=candidate division Kazan bacterium RIFCSPLOWO2_01_FULL_45_19 TaxID=1798538 RepID=A0A1F4NSF2_UNCK3|nr:MAG: hypothetical protein A3K51_03370 [candidate division Kazan bacterium RIFCSPLOWO2_01_FULL_45_19]OGB78077.1 MAG: hypothetical protein A3K24_03370 [candidate division Kazan bacterium RIFCSPHIGHO2_01_FULL_44_14]